VSGDVAHTHGGQLSVSIAQDVDTRRWYVLVSLAPYDRIPAGHLVAADLKPEDVDDVVDALLEARRFAVARNAADELPNAITVGLGDGL